MSSSQIQEIFEFTEDDLSSNRAGQLSPQQTARFKRDARIGAAFIIVFIGIFFAMTLFATIAFSTFAIIGAIVWGVVCAGLGIVEFNFLRQLIAPQVPNLKQVSGHIVRGNPTGKSRGNFEVEVNGEAFQLSNEALSAFEPDKAYTFYLSEQDNRPFSVEEVSSFSTVIEKSPEQIAEEKFQKLYSFSSTDLSFNRVGQLSSSQLEQRQEAAKNNWGCFAISLVLAFGLGAASIGFWNNLLYTVITGVVIFVILYILSINSTRSQLKALETAQVLTTSGIAFASIGSHRTGGKNSHTVTDYYITIGDIRFQLPEEQYYAFKEGSLYTMYYIQNTGSTDIVAAVLGA